MRFPFLLALAGLLVCLATPALAGETKYTNAKGKYVGKQDAAGRFIDAKGQVRGREDEKGRVFDAKGRYQGSIERKDREKLPTTSLIDIGRK